MARHVLEETPFGPDLSDDPGELGPEPAGVKSPEPLPGQGLAGAGITSNDAIHDSTPWAAVEGLNRRPDRAVIQPALLHPRSQDFTAIAFPLDHTDDASTWHRSFKPQVETCDPGAEGENPGGT